MSVILWSVGYTVMFKVRALAGLELGCRAASFVEFFVRVEWGLLYVLCIFPQGVFWVLRRLGGASWKKG